jgi:hypothetical protein
MKYFSNITRLTLITHLMSKNTGRNREYFFFVKTIRNRGLYYNGFGEKKNCIFTARPTKAI